MQYPEGYLESQRNGEPGSGEEGEEEEETPSKKRGKKRKNVSRREQGSY